MFGQITGIAGFTNRNKVSTQPHRVAIKAKPSHPGSGSPNSKKIAKLKKEASPSPDCSLSS